MTKDVIAAILERRSTRRFKGEMIPHATIGRILDAARWAPSAGNIQPWEFYVVYNKDKKQELVQAALGQKFLGDAPVVIVVCVKPEMSAARYKERGRDLYMIQDSAAAVQNILVAAEGYGLGTCWVGAFKETLVRAALNIGDDTLPVAIIPVGYAEEGPNPLPSRRSLEEIVKIVD